MYFMRYHGQTWEVGSRLRFHTFGSRQKVLPGDPAYPFVGDKEKDDYYDLGFKKRKVLLYKPEEHNLAV